MHEYYEAFIRLVTKAGNVTSDQQISFFYGGLKEALRLDVKAQKPCTLKAALTYAKLYESRLAKKTTMWSS